MTVSFAIIFRIDVAIIDVRVKSFIYPEIKWDVHQVAITT